MELEQVDDRPLTKREEASIEFGQFLGFSEILQLIVRVLPRSALERLQENYEQSVKAFHPETSPDDDFTADGMWEVRAPILSVIGECLAENDKPR